MIAAYRIVKPKRESSAFAGEGSRLFGGRWNSKGRSIVYVAGSRSLAAMEMLVHIDSEELLDRYRIAQVDINDSDVQELPDDKLPDDWRDENATGKTRAIGDEWLLGASSLALRVPSIIIPAEFNFLLNPGHRRFEGLNIRPFEDFFFDPRLLK